MMRKLDPIKHEEKKRQILEAAGRCFARDGFRGASTAAICAEAGISPGHLFHYFGSKEEIIETMAKANLERAAIRFQEISDGADIVSALASEMERPKRQRKQAGQPPLSLEMLAEAGRNPAVAKILHEHSQGMRTLLADLLRKGQAAGQIDPNLDADLTAAVLISMMDGAKTLTIRDPKLEADKSGELLRTMFARFLAKPSK